MFAVTEHKRRLRKLVDLKCVPLEAELRERFCRQVIEENERTRIARAARVDNPELIDRLLAAGFRPETLPALAAAPIAFAAWGSGAVTDCERRLAAEAVCLAELSGNAESIETFSSWLKERPGRRLWKLWQDYTLARLEVTSPEVRQRAGRRILDLATRVARASGGFLGFRRICFAEQQVLDDIQRVYALDGARRRIQTP